MKLVFTPTSSSAILYILEAELSPRWTRPMGLVPKLAVTLREGISSPSYQISIWLDVPLMKRCVCSSCQTPRVTIGPLVLLVEATSLRKLKRLVLLRNTPPIAPFVLVRKRCIYAEVVPLLITLNRKL